MSEAARAELAKLRSKYARVFRIRIEDVGYEQDGDESYAVFSSTDASLPRWSTGEVKSQPAISVASKRTNGKTRRLTDRAKHNARVNAVRKKP